MVMSGAFYFRSSLLDYIQQYIKMGDKLVVYQMVTVRNNCPYPGSLFLLAVKYKLAVSQYLFDDKTLLWFTRQLCVAYQMQKIDKYLKVMNQIRKKQLKLVVIHVQFSEL